MSTDVFLSYVRAEAHLAEPIYSALVGLGLDVFIDRKSIRPGSVFPKEIRDGLHACKALVALWTPTYHQEEHEWCLRECSFANSDDKLIPLALLPLRKRDLDIEFIRVSWLPLRGFRGEPEHPEWPAVVEALAAQFDRWAEANPADAEASAVRVKARRLRDTAQGRPHAAPLATPMQVYREAVELELDSTPWALRAPVGRAPPATPDAALRVGELFVEVKVGASHPQPLTQVHREAPAGRFLLLGDPGAGKTMVLKHHGLWCLREGNLTPIFLRASELRPTMRETLLGSPASAEVADELLDLARAGRAALLVDSIDEVEKPDEKARVRKQLQLLAKDPVWAKCPIFAASRSVGYTEVLGFQELQVLPLSEDALVDLLSRWEVSPERIEELRLEARAGGRLRSMCQNPLLVTLMAIVLRQRGEEPEQWSRTGLYRQAIEVLLTGRHRRLLDGSPGYRHGDLALQALSAHALAAHGTERRGVFTARDLAAGAAPWVAEVRAGAADGRVEGFLADLARETGLIETRGGGVFGFPHQTFAEYFAASELARKWAAGEGAADLERVLASASWDEAAEETAWRPYLQALDRAWPGRGWATARVGQLPESVKQSVLQNPMAAEYTLRPEHEATTAEVVALNHGILTADGHPAEARAFLEAVLRRRLAPDLVSRIGRALDQLDLPATHQVLDAMPGPAHWEQRRAVLMELPTLLARPPDVLRFLQERAARVTHGADLYWLHRLGVWLGAGKWGRPAREVQARAAEWAAGFWASHRPEERRPVLGALRAGEWAVLEGGTFHMGSQPGKGIFDHEQPRHAVLVTSAFQMLKTPVTNQLYERFDPHHRSDRRSDWTERPDDHPVYNVCWYEAMAFAQWLDAGDPEWRVRLPFEVEHEYATRLALRELPAESTGVLAWYKDNAGGRVHPVGSKPDPDGRMPGGPLLFDLLGNVWQWCADVWDARRYARQAAASPYRYDPRAETVEHPTEDPETHGAWRVGRGGGWGNPAERVRVAFRNWNFPGLRSSDRGFRLVRVPRPPSRDPRS